MIRDIYSVKSVFKKKKCIFFLLLYYYLLSIYLHQLELVIKVLHIFKRFVNVILVMNFNIFKNNIFFKYLDILTKDFISSYLYNHLINLFLNVL